MIVKRNLVPGQNLPAASASGDLEVAAQTPFGCDLLEALTHQCWIAAPGSVDARLVPCCPRFGRISAPLSLSAFLALFGEPLQALVQFAFEPALGWLVKDRAAHPFRKVVLS